MSYIKLRSGHFFASGAVKVITPMDADGSFSVIGEGFNVKVCQWNYDDPIYALRMLVDEGFLSYSPEEVAQLEALLHRIIDGEYMWGKQDRETLEKFGEEREKAKNAFLARGYAEAVDFLMGS